MYLLILVDEEYIPLRFLDLHSIMYLLILGLGGKAMIQITRFTFHNVSINS